MRLERKSKKEDDQSLEASKDALKEEIEKLSKGDSSKIVGAKVRVSGRTIAEAKKINMYI